MIIHFLIHHIRKCIKISAFDKIPFYSAFSRMLNPFLRPLLLHGNGEVCFTAASASLLAK